MNRKILPFFGIMFILSSVCAFAALDLKFNNTINMAPASPAEGATVSFSVMFVPAGAAVNNLKCTWGIDGTTIGQKTFAHLNAGATTGLSFVWTATSGDHTAWFELDPAHALGDSDYSNNRTEKSITIGGGSTGKPNLTVSANFTPGSAANGTIVAFTAIVTNSGNAASVPSKLGFFVFGVLEKEFDIPALTPGQTKNVSHNWTANCTPPCNAYVSFVVDSTNIVTESNELDNTWVKDSICSCSSGQLPNLQVSASFTPTLPLNGAKVSFTATVTNAGNANADPCKLGFYVTGQKQKELDIPALVPAQSKTFTFDWTAVCNQSCKAQMQFMADCNNIIVESNESDNVWISDLNCDCVNPNIPNFKVMSTYTPTKFKSGDPVKFLIYVENTSAVQSPEVMMSFSESGTVRQTFDVKPIEAFKSVVYPFEWIANCNSNCRNLIDIFVDNQNQATESNENDNHWSTNVDCNCKKTIDISDKKPKTPTNKPNYMRVQGVNLTMYPGSFVSSAVNNVVFLKFSIINNGSKTAKASNVQVQTNDGNNVLFSTVVAVPALGPGETFNVTVHGATYIKNCQAVITIDCYNVLTESNKTDNQFIEILK